MYTTLYHEHIFRCIDKFCAKTTKTTKHFGVNDAFCVHFHIKGSIHTIGSENAWFGSVELKTTAWSREKGLKMSGLWQILLNI
jgi:hypothetical protein